MKRRSILFAFAVLPLAGSLIGCSAVPPPDRLSGNDAALVTEAEAYLNSLHTLRARFAQVRNGEENTGTVWMRRPGELRLQYDPPSPNVLVASHGHVVFADLSNGGTTSMPLARTPLAMLLAPQIVLSGPVTVVSVHGNSPVPALNIADTNPVASSDAGIVSITVRSTKNPGQGTLTLHLSKQPLALRGLDMVDARENQTSLRLIGTQTNVPTDDALFKVGN